ncbi:MAG TPA: hypothetical protein VEB40_05095, partial [Flavipsychrobacter sp.]|nr:hypothetical protein [Flavipsychrobacter sp.]
MSQNELYELYEQLKAQYTDARLQILRDEFQEKSDNSAFFYEFRLRDEVYSNEKGVVDVADSSVIGMLLPNYACFYYTLHNGVASKILFDYQGNIESLDTFRKLALQIISSYQLN